MISIITPEGTELANWIGPVPARGDIIRLAPGEDRRVVAVVWEHWNAGLDPSVTVITKLVTCATCHEVPAPEGWASCAPCREKAGGT